MKVASMKDFRKRLRKSLNYPVPLWLFVASIPFIHITIKWAP